MDAVQSLHAYRRMLAAPDDSAVCWWYSGWTFVEIAGHGEIPLSSVVAIMRYDTETRSNAGCKIRWSEIGAFRNPATSQPPERWTNPVTGLSVQIPRSFEEGPGSYTIALAPGPGTVALTLEQPFAEVRELSAHIRRDGDRVFIVQTERKVRGFPLADGSLPPPGSASGFEAETILSFFAAAGDALADRGEFVPCQGIYRFTLSGIPPWMGFGALQGRTVTRGVISKSLPGAAIDPTGRELLAQIFPTKIKHS